MRITRTYTLLVVSRETYEEIRDALETARYFHAFDGDVIDMNGIAITTKEENTEEKNEKEFK